MKHDISDIFEVGNFQELPDTRTKWQKFWYEVKWFAIIVAVGLWLGWFIHTWAMVIVINSLIK
jgi:hypothetical protein